MKICISPSSTGTTFTLPHVCLPSTGRQAVGGSRKTTPVSLSGTWRGASQMWIHVASKQEFRKANGEQGSEESNSPPWLQVPTDHQRKGQGRILWGGIQISPFLLIFSGIISATSLLPKVHQHILLRYTSLWTCRHRFPQGAWDQRMPWARVLSKGSFIQGDLHQACGEQGHLPDKVGTLGSPGGRSASLLPPALLLPAKLALKQQKQDLLELLDQDQLQGYAPYKNHT